MPRLDLQLNRTARPAQALKLWDAGLAVAQIAQRMGVTASMVNKYLLRAGLVRAGTTRRVEGALPEQGAVRRSAAKPGLDWLR